MGEGGKILQINTNVSLLTTRRMLDRVDGERATALQRLASGLRINSARDDAAGLAISERFSAQIRGQNQAVRNASDAISMLQTAEGSLSEVGNMLQRMRELAVQGANSTLGASDKASLQAEVNQLLGEINRIGSTTTFNGVNLFSSSGGSLSTLTEQEEFIIDGLRGHWLKQSETMILDYYGLSADGADLEIIFDETPDPNALAYVSGVNDGTGRLTNLELHVDLADFPATNPPDGGSYPYYSDRIIAHEMVHAVMARTTNFANLSTWFLEGAAEFIHGADERVSGDLGSNTADQIVASINGAWSGSSAQYSGGYVAVRYMHATLKNGGGDGIRDVMEYLSSNEGSTLDDALANVTGSIWANEAAFLADFTAGGGNGSTFLSAMDLSNTDTGAIGGLDADGGAALTATSVVSDTATYSDDPLSGFAEIWDAAVDETGSPGSTAFSFQVGAEADDKLEVRTTGVDATSMGIADIDLTDNAARAIFKLDRAIDYLSELRGQLGAQLNRLESTIEVASRSAENASASRSRILDADYASETAQLTRTQILQQAATAMTAQAALQPQLALSLLG